MAGKKGMKHYGRELKERAVHMALDEGMGYAAITQALAIRDRWRVRRWFQAYRQERAQAFAKPKGRPRKPAAPQDELARLRMENELLKKYHSELRKVGLAKRNIGSSTTRGQNTR
jgi:transposase-like protein